MSTFDELFINSILREGYCPKCGASAVAINEDGSISYDCDDECGMEMPEKGGDQ